MSRRYNATLVAIVAIVGLAGGRIRLGLGVDAGGTPAANFGPPPCGSPTASPATRRAAPQMPTMGLNC